MNIQLSFYSLLLCLIFHGMGQAAAAQSTPCKQGYLPGRQKDILCEKISAIPVDDRDAIEGFFHLFLLKEAGAYTLFGDKPVSYDCYFDPSSSDYSPFNRRYVRDNFRLRKGWEAFTRYQHLFPSRTFLLKGCADGQGSVEVVLIHRKHFVEMVDQHLKDFKSVLGERINGEELLKTYEAGNMPLFKLLKDNHALC